MEIITPLLSQLEKTTFLGNTLAGISIAIIAVPVFFFIFKIIHRIIAKRMHMLSQRTDNHFDDMLSDVFGKISHLFFLGLSVFIVVKFYVQLSPKIDHIVNSVFSILVAYELLKLAQHTVDFFLGQTQIRKNSAELHGLKVIVHVVLWVIGILLVLSNMGFNVSTLVASLGIGGIAVALAAQNVLGDLLASFSIFLDKPFQIGDFITIGTNSGTVKKIGLKTTRIETQQGEELIVSNKELTQARVQNFKKMERRRVVFRFGVTYDTPVKKVKEIPDMVKTIIGKIKKSTFDRVHFFNFGASSLEFEVVYFVESDEYAVYMDEQQKINLAIMEKFEKEGIQMAFPTQTVYLKKEA